MIDHTSRAHAFGDERGFRLSALGQPVNAPSPVVCTGMPGVERVDIKALLGHSTINTTPNYTNVGQERMEQVVARL